ncbi:MAG: penicillin acylase family protein [Candidatus Aminicenantes bacterium]|nr:penicillin acylase family protein [Candidatus Aminicenantes bacterium]
MREDIKITRDQNGVPHIEAEDLNGLYMGQGYVHARDRGLQMLLMRILGKGRASELLDSGDDTLSIDIFFRRMNWRGNTETELEKLSPVIKGYLESYCEGVNTAWKEKYPWEFKLLKYVPEPWVPDDSIMITRMIGYLTLAQSQAEIERLFVEMVQAGITEQKLNELFPGILGGLDLELLKKVELEERIVAPSVLWNTAVPRMMASNNWVISGSRTASGKPILANDPHLEVNRLPNIWSEIVMRSGKKYIMGGTMPGFPGVLTGRTDKLAWGVTYSFIDAVDSWIEKCKDGKYYREERDEWIGFKERKEIIMRKKKEDYEVTFYENEHGILDGDPYKENYYLSTKWTASDSGAISTAELLSIWDADTVEEGMKKFSRIETGWDFVFAGMDGDIGFQMSGLVPKRAKGISGFIPLPGWKKDNDWQGFIDPDDMPRSLNPATGYFATANHNLNNYGKAAPINMPMGSYRADRINKMLKINSKATIEDMYTMQSDIYSIQAELFMNLLKPLLPDSENGKTLREWDLKYDLNSKGAFLFEKFYKELMNEVFGRNGLGEDVFRFLNKETGIYIDFYQNFDMILLSENSEWFNGLSREELYKKIVKDALDCKSKSWGSIQNFRMAHLIFGNKLPLFMGFDKGPIRIAGGRATIQQGQIYRSGGRATTFMPSYRTVSDLSNNDFFSNLAGGPSDRRFSKWYISDLRNWLDNKFKKLSKDQADKTEKF